MALKRVLKPLKASTASQRVQTGKSEAVAQAGNRETLVFLGYRNEWADNGIKSEPQISDPRYSRLLCNTDYPLWLNWFDEWRSAIEQRLIIVLVMVSLSDESGVSSRLIVWQTVASVYPIHRSVYDWRHLFAIRPIDDDVTVVAEPLVISGFPVVVVYY